MKKRNIVLAAAAAAAVAVATTVAVAITSPADKVSANGGFHSTTIARSSDSFADASTGWVTVPGMSFNVNAPTKSLIVVRFSAESLCEEATDSGWCSIRVRIGGKVGEPDEGTSNAFDNGSSNGDEYEGHAATRSRIVAAGTHNVRVQMNANGHSFRLDDMSMEVQAIDV